MASPFPIEVHAVSMQVSDARRGKSTFQWITDIKPDELAGALAPMLEGGITQLEEHYGT